LALNIFFFFKEAAWNPLVDRTLT